MRGLTVCLTLILGLYALPATAAALEAVSFASLDGTRLNAWVLKPDLAPKGTVVALHGCGGLVATRGKRQGQLNARHQAMADLLEAQGYAVVFPDSLRPRGVQELCTQKIGQRTITQTERRRDVLATLNWVAAQPWARPNKIALLGWSHGGSAVLAATESAHPEVAAQSVKLALALAFYPGCGAATKANYQPNAKLILMLGEKDDWTPPGPCIALGKAVGAEVNVFADSYHDFDNPEGGVKLRKDVPNGLNPGLGVHAGANPTARATAYARLLVALRAAFD
ncbi:dienelactone hydrolase family protein [Rhodoferax sp.]|uniref:dienelactone hydrolase family protein n=1 Tax=Rhodoferax sp. TaxID=50421 RepID=UPI00275B6A62|nr:dienelactone hydrolase family protein [Rhodoferax sp.]